MIGKAMIDRLKALFSPNRPAGDDGSRRDDLGLATAALMVEAALMDGHMDDDERTAITRLLGDHFDLDPDQAAELLEAGHKAVMDTGQLYGFTKIIKDRFDNEERVRMIEMLWEVAYADGHVHHFESNLVRRLAGLLYVSDRESGSARKRVVDRLQPPSS